MPLVAPSPLLPFELRFGAPLLAQETSYLAASARPLSFVDQLHAVDRDTVRIYSITSMHCSKGRLAGRFRRIIG
ncbi:MAG: hypothetical protein BFD77_05485 [Pseudomonas sp. CO183]|nr:MAG: hypothetical protein BFD77_05485 [Pseudomonas sp. CO183]